MLAIHTKETTCDELATAYASQIKGKVILTTGVTAGGMGSIFAKSIAAAEPALLILAGRSKEKLEETASAIHQSYEGVATKQVLLDLGSMDDVRRAATEVNNWGDVPKIDVVVNNSAIMNVPYQLTADGFELQLATNYLGHFLFTNLIMKKILAAESPRIITLGSDAHRLSPLRWGDLHFDNGALYNGWAAYGQSKTAMMLMAIALAERLRDRGLLAFTIHPGVVFTTNLVKHLNPAVDIPNLRESSEYHASAVPHACSR
jgi:NAD(P)-dependent dehydrogenase (short-subunit alcohol dehydrogenase family)